MCVVMQKARYWKGQFSFGDAHIVVIAANSVLRLAIGESCCNCSSCSKVIWLDCKYIGHGNHLPSVFLLLCVGGTGHREKHREEENPCSPFIFHKHV